MATTRIAGLAMCAGLFLGWASTADAQVVVQRTAKGAPIRRPLVRIEAKPTLRPIYPTPGHIRPMPLPSRPRNYGYKLVGEDQGTNPPDSIDPPADNNLNGGSSNGSEQPSDVAPSNGLQLGWEGGIIGNQYDLTIQPGANGKLGASLQWTNPKSGRKGYIRFGK